MKHDLEKAVIGALHGMLFSPRALVRSIKHYMDDDSANEDQIDKALINHFHQGANDKIRLLLAEYINKWDYIERDVWTSGTLRNTPQRRHVINSELKLSPSLSKLINKEIPPYCDIDGAAIIEKEATPDWYTERKAKGKNFYWENIRKNMLEKKALDSSAVASIDAVTTSILNRLSNPADKKASKKKGLVVGHVQSGKTTNFTALIAKSIDSGYKLIIILAGVTDLLRRQTQKRIDMDLVGVEQIVGNMSKINESNNHEYSNDSDWPMQFVSYNARPSSNGHIGIERITTYDYDFAYAQTGQNRIRCHKKNKASPLFSDENILHSDSKLIVAKKEPNRLRYLIAELEDLTADERSEIPTLIIDDESDQASINTKEYERTAINKAITDILKLLPRAQYIGYTATPQANVFIKPDDNEDLYPSDFIFSLERPKDYMGPDEFTDIKLAGADNGKNKECHVRGFKVIEEDNKLQEALDSFLVSGAIKCFRERGSKSNTAFKHHTMMFHESTSRNDHTLAAEEITKMWNCACYNTPSSIIRLQKRYIDFKASWEIKGRPHGLDFPSTFLLLKKLYLGQALTKIQCGPIVLKVNSDADAPDFSARSGIWKILVGGAKLSRGYTVEGLTISFFQRNAKTQDTLMQMGRWFGYRRGYNDLIRLYIPTNLADNKGNETDLYEKFESLCRDEEYFRRNLSVYSSNPDFTPDKVPVLVPNSHKKYKPTSNAKMRNAEIVSAFSEYREPTTQALQDDNAKLKNIKNIQDAMRNKSLKKVCVNVKISSGAKGKNTKSNFYIGTCTADEILSILENTEWEGGQCLIGPETNLIKTSKDKHSKWLFIVPDIGKRELCKDKYNPFKIANISVQCLERTPSIIRTRINAFNSPEHVVFAKWLAGLTSDEWSVKCDDLIPDKKCGVFIFWPTLIKETDGKPKKGALPVTGFAIAMPQNLAPSRQTLYRVKKSP